MGLFLIWGSVLSGVLPGRPDVSWQAHLSGALAGVLAAWLFARRRRPVPSDGAGTLRAPF